MTADPSLETEKPDFSRLVGTVVASRYRIDGIIGQGGMGVVYRGEHVHTGRRVAVKMLLPGTLPEEQVFKRFQQEAKAASLLSHPNIISILDFGTEDDHAYLVMDYLDGASLDEVLEAGPLKIARLARIILQACRALAYAHKRGIVHRDLKPSNVMLIDRDEEKDVPVLVDFGLVKIMSADANQKLTTTNTIIGSPLYMSPEQCRGQAVDHRSDIYSLGCLMYRCLAGTHPCVGESALDTFYKHVAVQPEAFSVICPDLRIPDALEKVILKCLAKLPGDRYQSMSEIANDICVALSLSNSDQFDASSGKLPNESVTSGAQKLADVSPGSSGGQSEGGGGANLDTGGTAAASSSDARAALRGGTPSAADSTRVSAANSSRVSSGGAVSDNRPIPKLSDALIVNAALNQSDGTGKVANRGGRGKSASNSAKKKGQLVTMIVSVVAALIFSGVVAFALILATKTNTENLDLKRELEAEKSPVKAGPTANNSVQSSPAPIAGSPSEQGQSIQTARKAAVALVPRAASPNEKPPHHATSNKAAETAKLMAQEALLEEEAGSAYDSAYWSTAVKKYSQCLVLKQKILGSDKSPLLLPIYAKLAVAARQSGDMDKTVYFINRFGELFYADSCVVNHDVKLLWQLATICKDLNNLQLCQDLQEKVVAAREQAPVPGGERQLCTMVLTLARTYASENKNTDAEKTFRKALNNSARYRIVHAEVVAGYARFLRRQGRKDEAQRLETDATTSASQRRGRQRKNFNGGGANGLGLRSEQ